MKSISELVAEVTDLVDDVMYTDFDTYTALIDALAAAKKEAVKQNDEVLKEISHVIGVDLAMATVLTLDTGLDIEKFYKSLKDSPTLKSLKTAQFLLDTQTEKMFEEAFEPMHKDLLNDARYFKKLKDDGQI